MTATRRLLLILLTLAMVVSVVPTAFAADDVTANDVYVLQRKGMGPPDYTDYGTNYQYKSPYESVYVYNGTSKAIDTGLFSMMNNRTGNVIPTYCLDVLIPATGGTWYRRLNLEDSTYSASVAGRIRAIMLKGFYIDPDNYASSDAHEAAIEANVLKLATAANVENLTLGESITATQLAIWQVTHGSVLSFDPLANAKAYKPSTGVVYSELCSREMDGWTSESYYYLVPDAHTLNNRIRTVYNYLLSLAPIPVSDSEKVVSPASFTQLNAPVSVPNEDGTYDVSVTATVNVNMKSGDWLTLKATLGNRSNTCDLSDGSQTVILTFEDVPAELADQDVTLSISGYQTASGVFLFDAEGERGSSQTMVAMDSSQLPVYAEVVAQQDRELRINKTTTSGAPLEGIIFDIYPSATMEEYLSGEFDISNPTVPSKLAEHTLITNANGYAALNLTQHGLKDGVYLVVERPHPAIVRPLDPFYVLVPMTNAEGTGLDYAVNLFPKNEVKGGVTIGKDVITLGNDVAPVDAYSNHTWIISASIPDDISLGNSYVISDTLDNRLDYAGNVTVTVETVDGETVAATLVKDTDYVLNVTDADSLSEGNPSDSFILSLTNVGRAAVADAVGTNSFGDYRIRVYFDAQVNANAQMAEEIPNQASISYTNSVNFTFTSDSDKPIVYTGGANLLKVDKDSNDTVLSGATFEVYRIATEEEVHDNVAGLTAIAGVSAPVIKASFFSNADLTETKVDSATTGTDGKIAIYGLAPGNYYLVETQSPPGYNLLGSPVELVINETSHLEQNVVMVENVSGTVLPETGGMGTHIYVLSGIALMALALLLISKKRKFRA